ncbi:hypothetical protein ACQ4PT_004910 [Festuca glaucescens]
MTEIGVIKKGVVGRTHGLKEISGISLSVLLGPTGGSRTLAVSLIMVVTGTEMITGFYVLEVEVSAKPGGATGTGALVQVLAGNHSAKILEEVLKYWVEGKWQWNVRMISASEYCVTFPSVAALRICMRSSEPVTPLYKMRVSPKEYDLAPGASSMLQSTWVKVFEVPADARNEGSIKEISKTFGRPRDIDTSTLARKGPIRVKVDCRDPRKLRGRVEIFMNSAGFKFRIEAEGIVWNLSDMKPDSPHDDDPDDKTGGADDDDDEVEEEWDRHRLQNKDKTASSGTSGKGRDINEEISEDVLPKCTPEDAIFDKSSKNVDELMESDGDDNKCADEEGWILSGRKKAKRSISDPIQAKRKSSRVTVSEVSMMEKAANLVATKNLESAGMNQYVSNSKFAVLNTVAREYLEKIALDSKIHFDSSLGSNVHQILFFKLMNLCKPSLQKLMLNCRKKLRRGKTKSQNL